MRGPPLSLPEREDLGLAATGAHSPSGRSERCPRRPKAPGLAAPARCGPGHRRAHGRPIARSDLALPRRGRRRRPSPRRDVLHVGLRLCARCDRPRVPPDAATLAAPGPGRPATPNKAPRCPATKGWLRVRLVLRWRSRPDRGGSARSQLPNMRAAKGGVGAYDPRCGALPGAGTATSGARLGPARR